MSLIWILLLFTWALQASTDTPPETWQEHWFEHNQTLTRVFFNDDLAVYFDDNVNRSITWPNTYLTDVWRYVKQLYGPFGPDPRLFAVFHAGRYPGGHDSTYFDASHDFRSTIDVGSDDLNAWIKGMGNDLDLTTQGVGHIVEGSSKGFHNSPAFAIWMDSKWNEICIYDVYTGLGRTADAERWYNLTIPTVDTFPRPGTMWFKNWFYPIYTMNPNGSATLNNFFELLARFFPKNGTDYARDMNMGEFVHYWSGAVGRNLKDQATLAFGWTDQMESQFNQARVDFPDLPYEKAPVGKTIHIKGNNNLYVSSEDGKIPMNSNRQTAGSWETFTVGDVGNGNVVLQGVGQQFVSSNNGIGGITCNRPTFQAWEVFFWQTNLDGTFSLLGNNRKYVSSEDGTQSMTCNRDIPQDWEKFSYEMANDAPIGKTIHIKGNNNLFVSSEDGQTTMNCNRPTADSWETFTVVDVGNGYVALQSMGQYVSSNNGIGAITCDRSIFQAWEVFYWQSNNDGTFSLQCNNQKYMSSEDGTQSMTCNRDVPDDWEKFTFEMA